MPVDNDNIQTMIDSANAKLNNVALERGKLNKFLVNCASIHEVPERDDPEVMKPMMDIGLGKQITPARRQAKYDKLLTDKITLGL